MMNKSIYIVSNLLIFFLILTMNTIYSSLAFGNIPLLIKYIFLSLLILDVFFCIVVLSKNNYNIYFYLKKYAPIFIAMIVYFILSVTMNKITMSNVINYLLVPIGLSIIFYSIHNFLDNNYLIKSYIGIVYVLAIVSLFLYILYITGIIKLNMSMVISWGDIRSIPGFFGIYFTPQAKVGFLGILIQRNTFIFTEAPMYSLILSIAFILNVFKSNITSKDLRKNIILGITILTTTSTTGLLVIVVSLFLLAFFKIESKYKYILAILVVPLVYQVLNIIIISKMINMNASYSIRLNDFYSGIQAWLLHPFFGNGLSSTTVIQSYMDPNRLMIGGNKGFSSGFLSGLSETGIFGMIIYCVYPCFKIIKSNIKNISFVILFFILLFNTIFFLSYVYSFIICFFLQGEYFYIKDELKK